MSIIFGSSANLFNMGDNNNPRFNLDGVKDVKTVTVGDRTFVYTASPDEGGISGFEVMADGQLLGVANVSGLDQVENVAFAMIDGSTFLYANSGDTITVFQIAADGDLNLVQTMTGDAAPYINQIGGRMDVVEVAGVNYLVAAGNQTDHTGSALAAG
ncbi:hypothetical protein O4H61_08075 [Roseovarius aestuarii]|nr:hypothetical protein [Roseovarius aestuarii]